MSRPTAKQRILYCLRAADGDGWVWGVDLSRPDVGGLRYGGRLHELRADGYDFEKRPHPGSAVPDYRLVEAGQLALAI